MKLSWALAWAGILLAQQQPPAAPQEKCAIEGKVVNLVTGQPVRKARLILSVAIVSPQPALPAVVTSGADGAFSFPDLDPGIYRLASHHDNYADQQYAALFANDPIR